jgi:hypothetical protein
MSPLVKTKRQANFKDFKRFEAFKELVEQKNVVFNSFLCKLGFFGTRLTVLTKNSFSCPNKKQSFCALNTKITNFCSTLSEFENFLLYERIWINVTTCQNETSS